MNSVHGIIYAYHAYPDLRELGMHRTGAALPFCGRYRLIDFALSGMMRAGIHNVGVIMQRGYLSLMEHLGSGLPWNLARVSGGLHLFPPYGLPDAGQGTYAGSMEALSAVYSYLKDTVREKYILITRGDLCANVDMQALIDAHIDSGADITALCIEGALPYLHHRFMTDEDGTARELLCSQEGAGRGKACLETYILSKAHLLELIEWCREHRYLHFHTEALSYAMEKRWKVHTVMHDGYGLHITSVQDYLRANLDMLDREKRMSLFPADRKMATRSRSDTSTYYSDTADVKNSLIADGCYIEGSVENCVLFRGVRVAAGAVLKNCIILNDTVIGEHAELTSVISDKEAELSPYLTLRGSEALPLVIPKRSKL